MNAIGPERRPSSRGHPTGSLYAGTAGGDIQEAQQAQSPTKPKAPKVAKAAKAPEVPKPPKVAKAPTVAAAATVATKPAKVARREATAESAASLPKDPTQQAASYARNGGLAFALGGLISAITYVFSNGPYLLAWAPLLAGLLGLAWWGGRYLRIPKRAWRPDHVLLLGGLVLFGVVAAGWVSLIGTSP